LKANIQTCFTGTKPSDKIHKLTTLKNASNRGTTVGLPKDCSTEKLADFKKTATETNAKTVLYVIAQSIPNKNYTTKTHTATINARIHITDNRITATR
jgi:hypothetical protein